MPVDRLLACVAFVVLLTACNANDARFLRDGVGTDLFTPESTESAQAEDVYVGHLCRRAGLLPAAGVPCEPDPVSASQWSAITQAGFNDIDQRCDAYLSWLDSKRRNVAPGLQQLGDMNTAVDAFLVATGAGVQPLALAAAAFGIARNTFTNFNSRLILEVNHSTVQTIVLNRQNDYRAATLVQRINNRPAAMHALRNYLRICMPFTIETEINTTITTFERGGPEALDRRTPLIDPSTVGPFILTGPRAVLPPATKRQVIGPTRLTPFEQSLSAKDVRDLRTAMCLDPAGDLGSVGSPFRLAFAAYLAARGQAISDRIDQKLESAAFRAVEKVVGSGNCATAGFANATEVGRSFLR